jgi:hypothetical protein
MMIGQGMSFQSMQLAGNVIEGRVQRTVNPCTLHEVQRFLID